MTLDHTTETTALLERADDLERIDRALRAAVAGTGSVVVVHGRAGIGKTRLLHAVRAHAPTDLRVLSARGSDRERDFAFGVVRQLLEATVIAAEPAERDDMLAGAAAWARHVVGGVGDRDLIDDETPATFAVLNALYWVCANITQRGPLLLAVDDAQWADGSSLRFLDFLARRIDELPIALVITLRPLDTDADEALRTLIVDPAVERIELRPLGPDSVARLVSEELGHVADPAFVDACHRATGGLPFLVRELSIALRDDGIRPNADAAAGVANVGPRTIAHSILVRLGRLAPEASQLARAVAVLGTGADLRHAAALAGLDPGAASTTADALAVAGIFEPGRPLVFSHAIVEAAVLADLAPGERAAHHAAAAAMLVAEHAGSRQIAAHLLEAEPVADPAVVAHLRRAAADAVALGAPESAATYLERALREPPEPDERVGLLIELGTALNHAGSPRSVAYLEQAVAASRAAQDRHRAVLALGRALVLMHRERAAAEVFADAARAFAPDNPGLAMTFEAAVLGAAQADTGLGAVIVEYTGRLRDRLAGSDVPAAVLATLAWAAAVENHPAGDVVGLATRALDLHPKPYPQPGDPHLFFHACAGLLWAEAWDVLRPYLDEALEHARRLGSLPRLMGACCWRSALQHARGSVADAENDARTALEAASGTGPTWYRPFATAMAIEACVARGAIDDAQSVLDQQDSSGSETASLSAALLRCARGRLLLAQGEVTAARDTLSAVGRQLEGTGITSPNVGRWRIHAAAAESALGNHAAARVLLEHELALARVHGGSAALGTALRAVAGARSGDDQIEGLVQAVDVLQGSGATLELATATTELGAALRRAGRRIDARQQLRRGLDLAHRCGASGLVESARAELVTTGARPRRTALYGADALTPSERRVADLAASGATNREIAQSLYVTARTIETHLTHVYQKLGIASRAELEDALRDRGGD